MLFHHLLHLGLCSIGFIKHRGTLLLHFTLYQFLALLVKTAEATEAKSAALPSIELNILPFLSRCLVQDLKELLTSLKLLLLFIPLIHSQQCKSC